MAEGQGNFGNSKQHAKAGSMSSGNAGKPGQHYKAAKKGAARTAKRMPSEDSTTIIGTN